METFYDIINGSKPVLVDFYASWCGPCKAMSPIIQQVATHNQEKIRVIKIDVDKNKHLAGNYGIQSVPTLIIFKNGKTVWKHSGTIDKHKLQQQIASFSH